MAVTAGTNIITQSGTDNDLSNFSGVTGADYTELASNGTVRIVSLNSTTQLIVDGTMVIDGLTDKLFLLRTATSLQLNGTLTLGVADTDTGLSGGTKSQSLTILGSGNPWHGNSGNQESGIRCSGTLNLLNTVALCQNAFQIRGGGSLTIRDSEIIVPQGNASGGRSQICWLRANSTIDIDGLVMTGGELLFNTGVGAFSNIERRKSPVAIFPNRVVSITLEDLSVGRRDNTVDITIQTEGLSSGQITNTTVINSDELDLAILGAESGSDTRNFGYVKIQRRCQVQNMVNNNGQSVTGSLFIRDVNNSERKNLNSIDDTADKTYFQAVASGDSASFLLDILIVNVASGAKARGTKNTGVYSQDMRGTISTATNGTVEDVVLSGTLWSYLNDPVSYDFSGKGLNTNFQTVNTLVDSTIEEQDVAVTSALTGISLNQTTHTITIASNSSATNWQQIYEYCKYLKTTQAVIEYPSLSSRISTKTGTTIDFGSINIVDNKGLLRTSTVTDVTTTGSITRGESYSGDAFLTDSNDRTVQIINIPTGTVHFLAQYEISGVITVITDQTSNTNTTAFFFIPKTATLRLLYEDEDSGFNNFVEFSNTALDSSRVIDVEAYLESIPSGTSDRNDITVSLIGGKLSIVKDTNAPVISANEFQKKLNGLVESQSSLQGLGSLYERTNNSFILELQLTDDSNFSILGNLILPSGQNLINLSNVQALSIKAGTSVLGLFEYADARVSLREVGGATFTHLSGTNQRVVITENTNYDVCIRQTNKEPLYRRISSGSGFTLNDALVNISPSIVSDNNLEIGTDLILSKQESGSVLQIALGDSASSDLEFLYSLAQIRAGLSRAYLEELYGEVAIANRESLLFTLNNDSIVRSGTDFQLTPNTTKPTTIQYYCSSDLRPAVTISGNSYKVGVDVQPITVGADALAVIDEIPKNVWDYDSRITHEEDQVLLLPIGETVPDDYMFTPSDFRMSTSAGRVIFTHLGATENHNSISIVCDSPDVINANLVGEISFELNIESSHFISHISSFTFIARMIDGGTLTTTMTQGNVDGNISDWRGSFDTVDFIRKMSGFTLNIQFSSNLEFNSSTVFELTEMKISAQHIVDYNTPISTLIPGSIENLNRSIIATTTTTRSLGLPGGTALQVHLSTPSGTYNNHYIVINDGVTGPIQRHITSHTNTEEGDNYILNAPIPSIPSETEVLILIRTTRQDGLGATLLEIESSTILAKEETIDAIKVVVDGQETKAQADARQVILVSDHDAIQSSISSIPSGSSSDNEKVLQNILYNTGTDVVQDIHSLDVMALDTFTNINPIFTLDSLSGALLIKQVALLTEVTITSELTATYEPATRADRANHASFMMYNNTSDEITFRMRLHLEDNNNTNTWTTNASSETRSITIPAGVKKYRVDFTDFVTNSNNGGNLRRIGLQLYDLTNTPSTGGYGILSFSIANRKNQTESQIIDTDTLAKESTVKELGLKVEQGAL